MQSSMLQCLWNSISLRRALKTALVAVSGAGMILSGACSAEDRASMQGVARSSSSATAGSVLFIPGSAHVSGTSGTNWRTDLEVANPGDAQASFTVALLKRDQGNSSPSTKSFTLDGGKAVRYEDALASMFGFSGAAALRIAVNTGMIAVTSRTYNATSSGTYGQFIDGVLDGTAIQAGQEGRIIQLSHNRSSSSGYRTNIGFVNATDASLALKVDLYLADGSFLGTRSYNLAPYEYRQIDKIFESVTGSDVDDGYAVLYTTTNGGRFFAYASVVDNRTGDPVYITPAMRQHGGAPPSGSPTPTPTPTPTPPAQKPNLTPYQPSGWTAPLVASGTTGTNISGGLVGGQSSYFDWALANYGPGDVHFNEGDRLVEIKLDGSGMVSFVAPEGGFTLQEGHYAFSVDYKVDNIPAGQHTGELIGDPSFLVAESDEGDNSYSTSWTWSSGAAAMGPGRTVRVPKVRIRIRPIPGWGEGATKPSFKPIVARWLGTAPLRPGLPAQTAERADASTDAIYIPASAHVSGTSGTNWRTDLELHNPGTVQGRYEVDLLKRDQDNSNPSTKTFIVEPGHSLRLEDVLLSEFGFSGAAALRITSLQGEVVVTSRTYNLTSNGTYGQFIAGVSERTAVVTNERALQIQLSHTPGSGSGFRTNVGMLNCTGATLAIEARFFSSSGSTYGTKTYTLKPYEFIQVDKIFEAVTGSTVADGYIRLSTVTPDGRFLAYASIIDNRTGDPVFAPAIPVLNSQPAPLAPSLAAETAFEILGQVGQGDLPSFVETASNIDQYGMEAVLDGVVAEYPELLSRIPNGIRIDFGDRFVLDDGSILSGSFRFTYRNLNLTSGHHSYDFSIDEEDAVWNGQYSEIDSVTGSVDVSIGSGQMVGDATFSGSGTGTLAVGSSAGVSITGSAHMDTSICPNYPISGSVTLDRGGEVYTMTFTDDCDGTYGFQSPGQTGDISFRLTWAGSEDLDLYVKEPNGEVIYFSNDTSATGGQLDVDSNAGCYEQSPSPTENIFWPVGEAPHGTYEFWVELYDKCSGSDTPAFTLEVREGTTVTKTYHGTISNWQSPHYTYNY